MDSYLELSHVTIDFPTPNGPFRALDKVKLSIDKGEFISLIGHSGCGKSTVLNIIAGLHQATEGGVILNGKEVSEPGPDRAVVFQNHSLLPWMTAYENVELPLLLIGKKNNHKARVMELLDAVGLTDWAKHRPDQLSGGQQQRVAVARALATNPSMILADEPTANLDTENGEQVMDTMKKLNEETGTTFVFATHDPRVINYAKRVVTLQDGLIVEDTKTE